jgi:hypothetical protein
MGRGRAKELRHLNQFVNMLGRIFQNEKGEKKIGRVPVI